MKLLSKKGLFGWLAVLLSVLLLAPLAAGCDDFSLSSGLSPGNTLSPGTLVTGAAPTTGAKTTIPDGINTINISDLPPEGRTTLNLIKSGGPFPYSKDGAVFNNYEKLLPQKPSGYYHEFTVVTPGSPDRGARRIVAGGDGEYYYTNDHYNSFRLVLE